MKALFACGGTAGHINPALAIASALKEIVPDCEILFVGSGRDLENRLIPMAGYKIVNITISGFNRGFSPSDIKHNIGTIKNLAVSASESKKIIRDFKPDVAIGTGGYVCYPILSQAKKHGVPVIIHESNAVAGLTTKMLSSKADRVLTAFKGVEQQYKKPENVIVTGTPVRGGFETLSKADARKKLGIGDEPIVVSFWGSLGASKMNLDMVDFVKLNEENGTFRHIHATGAGEEGLAKFRGNLEKAGVTQLRNSDIRPYIDDMPTVMSAADVILCRAGASTMSELTVMGKPAVIVPSPYVTDNHQQHNAEQLQNVGGAVMVLEKDSTGKVLYEKVKELLSDKAKLAQMGENLKTLGAPEAAERIAKMAIELCK